jgi:hypothetical protein
MWGGWEVLRERQAGERGDSRGPAGPSRAWGRLSGSGCSVIKCVWGPGQQSPEGVALMDWEVRLT